MTGRDKRTAVAVWTAAWACALLISPVIGTSAANEGEAKEASSLSRGGAPAVESAKVRAPRLEGTYSQRNLSYIVEPPEEPFIPIDPNNYTFTTSKGYHGEVIDGVTYIEGYLVANKTYALPRDYGDGLTNQTLSAFYTMQAGAKKDGLSIYISSGYRSYSTQKNLYSNYVKRDGVEKADTYSARAGHSEHQSGLAFDVNIVSDAFIGTPEAIWLADHCYEYGFILRYPQGKTDETGYKFEPWHFRYVGTELAEILYDGGNWITMEDYFGFTSQYQE